MEGVGEGEEVKDEKEEEQTCKSAHWGLDVTEEALANRALGPSHVVSPDVQLVDGWVFLWFRVK